MQVVFGQFVTNLWYPTIWLRRGADRQFMPWHYIQTDGANCGSYIPLSNVSRPSIHSLMNLVFSPLAPHQLPSSLYFTPSPIRCSPIRLSSSFHWIFQRHSTQFDAQPYGPSWPNSTCRSTRVYNWLVDFFSSHSHHTVFNGDVSCTRSISASIIQGSSIGPPVPTLSLQLISGHSTLTTHSSSCWWHILSSPLPTSAQGPLRLITLVVCKRLVLGLLWLPDLSDW